MGGNIALAVFMGVIVLGYLVSLYVWERRTFPKAEPQAPELHVIRVSEVMAEGDMDDVNVRIVSALAALAVRNGLPAWPLPVDWLSIGIEVAHAILGPELASLLADGEV